MNDTAVVRYNSVCLQFGLLSYLRICCHFHYEYLPRLVCNSLDIALNNIATLARLSPVYRRLCLPTTGSATVGLNASFSQQDHVALRWDISGSSGLREPTLLSARRGYDPATSLYFSILDRICRKPSVSMRRLFTRLMPLVSLPRLFQFV